MFQVKPDNLFFHIKSKEVDLMEAQGPLDKCDTADLFECLDCHQKDSCTGCLSKWQSLFTFSLQAISCSCMKLYVYVQL